MEGRPRHSADGPQLALTVSQVAARLAVSVGTVRRWADSGALESFRTPGGQRRFDSERVEEFLRSLEQHSGGGGRK
jgi:excisionase family DNA binding protein